MKRQAIAWKKILAIHVTVKELTPRISKKFLQIDMRWPKRKMAKIFIQKSISQRRMSKKQKAYEKSSGKCTLKPQQDTTTYPLGWLKLEQFKL